MTPGIQHEAESAVARAAGQLAELRRRIAAQHAAGGPGVQTCGLASDLYDDIVVGVWRSILDALPPPAAAAVNRHVVLVAHGGYGRREMAPYSDVDLMLLYDGGTKADVAGLARRLVQDLFDAGMNVGQSVRTIAEARRLAAGDATIYSTLTECRPLAGNAELLERLTARLRGLARRSPQRLAERLIEEIGRAHV